MEIVRLSALAVFRLITKSYRVGCSTGISEGCAPRRTRSTSAHGVAQSQSDPRHRTLNLQPAPFHAGRTWLEKRAELRDRVFGLAQC